MSLCSLCMDLVDSASVSCVAGPHRFCLSCFTRYVAAECDFLNGRAWPYITCPYVRKGQCESRAFDDDFISEHVDTATYNKYMEVKQQRDAVKPARPAPITLDDYRTEVIEMLNPACPRCQTTFIDFSGCCSLSCRLCSCHFCAYCLQPKTNVPGHVMNCWYRDADDWRRGQLASARTRIVALLKPLPEHEQRQILNSCRIYFQELNVDVAAMTNALNL